MPLGFGTAQDLMLGSRNILCHFAIKLLSELGKEMIAGETLGSPCYQFFKFMVFEMQCHITSTKLESCS